MSEQKSKVPKLRFSGFTEPWVEYKAYDIFKTVSEKNRENQPVLSASQKLGMIRRDENGIDINYDKKSLKNYKLVGPGQFVIHLRSFQGGFAWSDIEGITSPAYTILDYKEPEKQVSKFWKEILTSSTFIKRLETITYGIRDGRSISFADFSTLKFMIPSVDEQMKIAKFFKSLDDVIKLQTAHLTHLKTLKKGLLQKMFPKERGKTPEIRFPGFTGDWEQRKLGEVGRITMGQSPLGSTYTDNPKDHILVQGNADMKNGKVTPRVWTTQITKTADIGNTIFSVRAPVGDVGKTDYDIVIGRGVAAIKCNEFVFQYLTRMKIFGYWNQLSTGSTFESINSADLKEAILYVPSCLEQAKIGQFFKTLDDTITLHQRKLEHLEQQKKALLQHMFI